MQVTKFEGLPSQNVTRYGKEIFHDDGIEVGNGKHKGRASGLHRELSVPHCPRLATWVLISIPSQANILHDSWRPLLHSPLQPPLRDKAKIAAWKWGTLGRQISWANLEFGAKGTTTDPSINFDFECKEIHGLGLASWCWSV